VVADALSRITSNINYLGSDTATASATESMASVHSALQDASDLFPHVEALINVFRNQLVFDPNMQEHACETPHTGYVRYLIPISNGSQTIQTSLKNY